MFKTHLRVIWITPSIALISLVRSRALLLLAHGKFRFQCTCTENFQFLDYSCHIIFLHEVNFKVS